MGRKIITVENSYVIIGRGVVLLPAFKILAHENIKAGDKVMLHKPNGTVEFQRIGGIEWPYPNPNKEVLILINNIQKEDIPIGTEIWTIR